MRERPVLRKLLLGAIAATLLLPGPASAALPRGGGAFEAHEHDTGGRDWHVQMEADKTGKRLATLVVYSQLCHETAYKQRTKVADDGSVVVNLPLANKKGRWGVDMRFTSDDTVEGTWAVTRGKCTDGGEFRAKDGDGHFVIGNQFEFPPARTITNGSSKDARALRHIKNTSLETAHRFNSRPKARALGYKFGPDQKSCPGFHHARKNGSRMWGNLLDPMTPQSLVFWCSSQRKWTLSGYMYRAAPSPKPYTYGDMMQWHKHGGTPTATWMTHVWLVTSPYHAWATCSPFKAYAAENMFDYEKPKIVGAASQACTDTVFPESEQ